MSILQNSCQQKVLCRTLVAQDKVGLISASRREKSVTLGRRAFHTQYELHLSPRPARPHSKFWDSRRDGRSGAESLSAWARLSPPPSALESAAWQTPGSVTPHGPRAAGTTRGAGKDRARGYLPRRSAPGPGPVAL